MYVDYAARIVLDVEQAGAVRVRGSHLSAPRKNFFCQRGRLARTPQDAFPDRFKNLSHPRVSGGKTRAAERIMLPDPGVVLLVARERLDRGHQQPGSAARPQPQVGIEQRAGRGSRGKPVVEALREPRVGLRRLLVRIVVEKDEVEVRGIAELLSAQLAVADHREARRAFEMPATQLAPDLLKRDLH